MDRGFIKGHEGQKERSMFFSSIFRKHCFVLSIGMSINITSLWYFQSSDKVESVRTDCCLIVMQWMDKDSIHEARATVCACMNMIGCY